MASRNLGTLTVDLIAKTAGFVQGMDKAERDAFAKSKKIRQSIKNVGKEFLDVGKIIGTAAAAIVAGQAALTISSIKSAKELSNLAKVANASAEEFQKYAFGAQQLGVEQDKLSDIFKDTTDKVGDFIATGAGPLADFFENIAPQVGVTADQFAKLSGPEALQLYVDSIEAANVSQAEMVFYMEAIASDATQLLPLLQNAGEGFANMAEEAEALGIILSNDDVALLEEAGIALDTLETSFGAFSDQLGAEFAPLITRFAKDFQKAAKEAGGFGVSAANVFASTIEAAGFVANAFDGVTRVLSIALDSVILFANQATARFRTFAIELTKIWDALLPGDPFEGIRESLQAGLDEDLATVELSLERLRAALEEPLAGDQFQQWADNARKAAEDATKAVETATQTQATVVDKALDDRLKALKNQYATEEQLARDKNKNELALIQEAQAAEALTKEEGRLLELESDAALQEELYRIEKEYSDRTQREVENRKNLRLASMSNLAGTLGTISTLMNTESRKLFEIGKVAGIAQATVSTAIGIMKAWELGPILGPILAPLVAVAGAAQIAVIKGTKFNGGGSAPTAGVSTTKGINAAATPVQGIGGGADRNVFIQGLDPNAIFSGQQIVDLVNEGLLNGANIQAV